MKDIQNPFPFEDTAVAAMIKTSSTCQCSLSVAVFQRIHKLPLSSVNEYDNVGVYSFMLNRLTSIMQSIRKIKTLTFVNNLNKKICVMALFSHIFAPPL